MIPGAVMVTDDAGAGREGVRPYGFMTYRRIIRNVMPSAMLAG
jgi:hypothetical protein